MAKDVKPSLRKRLLSRASSNGALPALVHPPADAAPAPSLPSTDPPSSSAQPPLAPPDPQRASADSASAAGHHAPAAPSAYRRKGTNAHNLQEGATSQSTLHSSILKSKSSASSRRSKKSIFTGVFRKVVPCVGPSSYNPPSLMEIDKSDVAIDASASATNPASSSSSSPVTPPAQNGRHTPLHVDTATADMDADVILAPPPSAKLLPQDETDGVTSGAVQPPGSTIRHHELPHKAPGDESDGMAVEDQREPFLEDEQAVEDRLIRNGGNGITIGPDGVPCPLLPPILPEHTGRKCLVLDLDETLVHSSFKPIQSPDFIVPVEIESSWHHFHVLKRPGVDSFLKEMGKIYEIVVFTASLSKYADPVLDKLDIHNVVKHRLFRESCYSHRGNYVKDLSQLGRPISSTIILDNSPASYIFHNRNAVPVSSWFNDPHDAELMDLVPFLADLTVVDDVTAILNLSRTP